MLRVIIVDDELPAREELRSILESYTRKNDAELEIIGECSNALEAIPAIHKLRPDVVFLDIQMPRISGLEMVSMLDPEHLPAIVFVTAYDEFALKAFEENAFDYLLKPIEPTRLEKTLGRLRKELAPPSYQPLAELAPLRSIPCCGHNRIFLVPLTEVEYIHSDLAGVHVFSAKQAGVTQLTLRTLEEKTSFLRCHRQYMINPDHVAEIQLLENGGAEVITRAQQHIPVSRRYLKPLKQSLNIP